MIDNDDTHLVGCVLFDDPDEHRRGVACLAGGDPVVVSGMHDLTPNQVVWLSNLSWEQARASGLLRNQRIRNAHYLRVSVAHICQELGIDTQPPGIRARILADLFAKVLQLSHRWFGVRGTPAGSLALGLHQAIFGHRGASGSESDSNLDRDLLKRLRAANPGYVFSEKPAVPRSPRRHRVPFRIHRPTHAAEMLGMPVPAGAWHPGPVPRYRDVNAWLAEQTRPLLLRVRLRRMHPLVSPLINFGIMQDPDVGGRPREWVSSVELMQLSRFMEVEILEMYVGDRYVELPVRLEAIKKRWLVHYAAGLLAENLWVAMARHDPAWRTWLLAYDRIACFLRAIRLLSSQANLANVVCDYGYGRLFVALDAESEHFGDRIATIALQTNLCPPVRTDPVVSPKLQTEIRRLLQLGNAGEIEIALALTGRRHQMLAPDLDPSAE